MVAAGGLAMVGDRCGGGGGAGLALGGKGGPLDSVVAPGLAGPVVEEVKLWVSEAETRLKGLAGGDSA